MRPAHIFVVHMHTRSSSVLIVYAIISKKSIDYILFFYYYKKYFSTSSQCFNVYFFIYCLRCPRVSCPSSANCSNTVKSKTSLIFTSSHIAIFSKNENTLFIYFERFIILFVRQGIYATTRCTISKSGQHSANLRMYLIFLGEKPDMSGNASFKRPILPFPVSLIWLFLYFNTNKSCLNSHLKIIVLIFIIISNGVG